MEKTDRPRRLRELAARMRAQAQETQLPDYRQMMTKTAATLEAEADRIEESLFPQALKRSIF